MPKKTPEPEQAPKADNYAKINMPAAFLTPHDIQTSDGRTFEKCFVSFPKGTKVNGIDVSGFSTDVFLSDYMKKDMLEKGRATVSFKKDGEKLLWREGDELINGERFFAMEQLCYSDATVQSINRRAIAVFDYLKHAHPTYSDDEIARIMGYTESAIERIRDAEISQDEGFVDDDGEGQNEEDNTGAIG